jgi:hypothetical protein
MENYVNRFLGEPDFDTAHAELDQRISMLKPFCVSLNDSQRVGFRTMAEGREGLVRTVCRISLTHRKSLPQDENPEELEKALVYYDKLAGLLQKVSLYYEMTDDTLTALGGDLMAMCDRYTGYLQVARTGNTSLDMALNQVDEYNKRFTGKASEEEPAPVTPVS